MSLFPGGTHNLSRPPFFVWNSGGDLSALGEEAISALFGGGEPLCKLRRAAQLLILPGSMTGSVLNSGCDGVLTAAGDNSH